MNEMKAKSVSLYPFQTFLTAYKEQIENEVFCPEQLELLAKSDENANNISLTLSVEEIEGEAKRRKIHGIKKVKAQTIL